MLRAREALALMATVVGFAGASARARAEPADGGAPTPDASPDGLVDGAREVEAPSAGPAAPAPVVLPPPSLTPAGGTAVEARVAGPSAPAELTGAAWFARPRLALSVGSGERVFKLRFFGFLAADYTTDSTQSYADSMGTSLVARSDTYAYHHGRTQFSLKSTRLGFGFESPVVGGVAPSAVLESDFAGSQAVPPGATEATYFASPLFRIRHAYVKLTSRHVDLLLGHTFDVFGWQSYFDPSGLRNQLFSRNPQLRLSRAFNPNGAVTVEVAAAAVRPAQRDSGVPDGAGGVRVSFNGWQGIRTPGNERIVAMPLTFAVSGIVRQFKVNAFTHPPVQTSNHATGWGVSLDAFVPIIPASNFTDRGNRLALMGSFVTGTGIADLLGLTGGAAFPTLPNPGQISPDPLYETGNVDQGIVSFDRSGVLHPIDWTAFRVGLQYYLPTTGRWIFSANYTQAQSANLGTLYPRGGVEIDLQSHVADGLRYADAKLSYDITPVMRVGVGGQYTQTLYLPDEGSHRRDKPHNLRLSGQAIYLF